MPGPVRIDPTFCMTLRIDLTFCMTLVQSRCLMNSDRVGERVDLRCSLVSLMAAGSLQGGSANWWHWVGSLCGSCHPLSSLMGSP